MRRFMTSIAGCEGFTKELYNRLDLRCTGMEFANEMIIKASLLWRKNWRSRDHPPPGRTQVPCSTSQDLPRWLAYAALLPDV